LRVRHSCVEKRSAQRAGKREIPREGRIEKKGRRRRSGKKSLPSRGDSLYETEERVTKMRFPQRSKNPVWINAGKDCSESKSVRGRGMEETTKGTNGGG